MSPADRPLRIAIAAALAAAAAAHAQDPRPGVTVPANMQPKRVEGPAATSAESARDQRTVVDPTVGDRHSLSESLRVMPVDLSPHGFDRVYAVPGRDDLLMRTNGALYAVFSQSIYGRDPKKGTTRVLIPASTVFYIGKPDFSSIRSVGVRDVDLSPAAAAAPDAAPVKHDIPGVRRVDRSPIDLRVDGDDHRVDGATDGRFRAPEPAEDRSAQEPVGPPKPPARADASAAPERAIAPGPDSRESRPGFRDRIDELMRRAKKAQ
jgi:hypothetical protein